MWSDSRACTVSLLVTHHGDVSRKLNKEFLLVDSFNFNFVDEDRSYIYVLYVLHEFLLCVYDRVLQFKKTSIFVF